MRYITLLLLMSCSIALAQNLIVNPVPSSKGWSGLTLTSTGYSDKGNINIVYSKIRNKAQLIINAGHDYEGYYSYANISTSARTFKITGNGSHFVSKTYVIPITVSKYRSIIKAIYTTKFLDVNVYIKERVYSTPKKLFNSYKINDQDRARIYDIIKTFPAPKSKKANVADRWYINNNMNKLNEFDLTDYLKAFIRDAKLHDIDLSHVWKGLGEIKFGQLKGDLIAVAYASDDDYVVQVKVDPENWKAANVYKRIAIMYHELAHDILNLDHGEGGPLMNERAQRSYTKDQLYNLKTRLFKEYKEKYSNRLTTVDEESIGKSTFGDGKFKRKSKN